MARSNRRRTIEFTSAAATYGRMRDARVVESSFDADGLSSWSIAETVYGFDVNGGRPEEGLLYPSRLVRTNGLVNGRRVYGIDECCLPNDDQMLLGCPDIYGPVELKIRLRVEYIEYDTDPLTLNCNVPTGNSGTVGEFDLITIGVDDPLAAYTYGDPVADIEDPGFSYSGPTWTPYCVGAQGGCWTTPIYEDGEWVYGTEPAILFDVVFDNCEDYPPTFTGPGSAAGGFMGFILPITNERVSESLGNQIFASPNGDILEATNLIGYQTRSELVGGVSTGICRVYYYYVEVL